MAQRTSAEQAELLAGVSSFMVCSGGMMVFNKMAVTVMPLQCTLVGLQLAFTAVAVSVLGWSSLRVGSYADFLRWLRVVPCFAGMLLTSMFALSSASMTTVITFRAVAPLVTMIGERFYPNPVAVTPMVCLSIICLVFGAVTYGSGMPSSDNGAIGWLLLNNACAIVERLLQRLMLAKDQAPVDISKPSMMLINNSIGFIVICVAGFLHHEVPEIPGAVGSLTHIAIFWIAASCIVSVGISYTGIWAQSLVTATTMLVLVNVNKFGIIFLEAFVLRNGRTMNVRQIIGACIAILASIAYGKARELSEKSKLPETLPILGRKV